MNPSLKKRGTKYLLRWRCNATEIGEVMERGGRMLRWVLCLGGGVVCFGLMAGFALVAKEFLAGGAGVQLGLVTVSGWGVLIGMVGVAGFILAGFFCFAVGVVLLAEGIVGRDRRKAGQ